MKMKRIIFNVSTKNESNLLVSVDKEYEWTIYQPNRRMDNTQEKILALQVTRDNFFTHKTGKWKSLTTSSVDKVVVKLSRAVYFSIRNLGTILLKLIVQNLASPNQRMHLQQNRTKNTCTDTHRIPKFSLQNCIYDHL